MSFDIELIEAKLALNLVRSDDMPTVAWEALEAGLDGPAIRRLAALEKPTPFEVMEVLPRARDEMGLTEISGGEAALRIAKRRVAEILERQEHPFKHTKEFANLFVRADYPDEIASIGNLDDEIWVAESMGESPSQIRAWVTERLRALIG